MEERKRKIVTIELETNLNNKQLEEMIKGRFDYPWNDFDRSKIIQLQINAIKKGK